MSRGNLVTNPHTLPAESLQKFDTGYKYTLSQITANTQYPLVKHFCNKNLNTEYLFQIFHSLWLSSGRSLGQLIFQVMTWVSVLTLLSITTRKVIFHVSYREQTWHVLWFWSLKWLVTAYCCANILRSGQSVPDNIFKCIFMKGPFFFSIKISWKFTAMGYIVYNSGPLFTKW